MKRFTNWMTGNSSASKVLKNLFASQQKGTTVRKINFSSQTIEIDPAKKRIGTTILPQIRNPLRLKPINKPEETASEKVYLNEIGGTISAESITENNLSNSSGVSDQLIKVPQGVSSFDVEALQLLCNLGKSPGGVFGAVMSMVTGLISVVTGALIGGAIVNLMKPGVPTGMSPQICHTGGVVTGQGESPTILMGGETVRTQAQEEMLKQMLYDKYVGLSPAMSEPQAETTEQTAPTQSQKPFHQRITRDDENFILNMLIDALDRNRAGLRTKIQGI